MAGAVQWVDVLPSMNKYGPSLRRGVMSSATSVGTSAGVALDSGMAKGASRGNSVGKFFGGIAKTGLKATAVIGGGVTALGGTIASVAAKKGLDRLLDIDSAQQKLKGLKMTESDIAKVMDSALASVKGTAFGLGDAATVASSAVAAGIKPGKDLTKYLKLTADSAAIAGTSLGEMGSIINKTTTSGKVYTDSLNQLSDRGIPIFQWLQKEYKVSADDLSTMVKKGQVDATTFRKVIQENIGGAALSSGDSVRGAWANAGAALGRIGAMFLKGGVSAAPKVLSSITNATDRAGAALAPYAEKINAKIVPALGKFAGWVDRIDFEKAAKRGDAFVRRMVVGFQQIGTSIKTGDMSSLGPTFGSFLDALRPLAPVVGTVLKSLAPMSGAIGEFLVASIKLAQPLLEILTRGLVYLGDHSGLLIPVILGLGAAFLVMKGGQAAARVTAVAMLPITLLQIAADFARTRALLLNTRAMLANTSAEGRSRLTRVPATYDIIRQTFALGAQRIALGATTKATLLGAVGMRVFGAALRFALGPVGLIITAVGLLVAGVIWAYKNVGWFRDFVNSAFSVIGTAAKTVGGWFVWLWQNGIRPALVAAGGAISGLWTGYVSPIFQVIGAAARTLGGAFSYLWTGYISPIFQLIGAIVKWLWTSIIVPTFGFIISFVRDRLGATFSWLYTGIVRPVFGYIGAVFSAWWSTIVRPVFGAVSGFVRGTLGPVFSWLYQTIIRPVFSAIGTVVRTVWTTWLKPVFDKVVRVAKIVLPQAFSVMKDAIGKAWEGVKSVVKAPIRFVVETVINGGIIRNFNKVADFFKTDKMPEIALPKGFARGGVLPGYGSAKRDTTMIPMRAGEGVLVPEVVRALGPGFVHKLNAAGNNRGVRGVRDVAGFAGGGIVGAATGAWDWIAGKAGKALDWAKDAAGTAASIVSDPMGTLGKLAKGALGAIPGGGAMLGVAKGIGTKILDGAVSALGKLGFLPAGGNGANGRIPASDLTKVSGFTGGSGVGPSGGFLRTAAARAWEAARAAAGGGLTLTEGYRDLAAQQYRWGLFKRGGNLAAAPGTSVHGLGLAADVGAGQSWLRANGARFGWYPTGLSFSQREPWHFEYKGARGAGGMAAGGVVEPWLYDDGGMLPPGLTLVANKTGSPEPVLTGDQFDALKRGRTEGGDSPLVGRDLVINTTGRASTRKVRRTLRSIKRGGPGA